MIRFNPPFRQCPRALTRLLFSVPLALTGCAQRSAPSFALFGAYFPAWLLCALIGLLAAVVARAIFVATGLSSVLPFQLFVCLATGLSLAQIVWLIWFA